MRAKLSDAHDAGIGPGDQVTHPNSLVSNVKQTVSRQSEGRSLSFQLEDDETVVVPGGEEVECRMSGQDPEAVVFPTEGLNGSSLGHIPHTDRLVLPVRQNELVARVENAGRDVVEVSPAGVDLPSFGVGHPPELDLTIITARDDQRQGRMERGPIDTSVVLHPDERE